MARPKKVVREVVEKIPEKVEEVAIPTLPPELSVDYPSEGLNNMARTINEIIHYLDAVQKR